MNVLALRVIGWSACALACAVAIAGADRHRSTALTSGSPSTAPRDASSLVDGLDSMQRRMLARLSARASEGAPVPEICFAPGTPPDVIESFYAAATGSSRQLESFRLSTRWSTTATNGGGLQQGDPTTITWSIVPDGTFIAGFAGEPSSGSDLITRFNAIYGSQAVWQALIQQVLDRWGSLTGARYVFEPNDDGAALASASGSLGTRADVRIGGHFIDGNSGVLAYNFFPDNGDMILDSADSFFNDTSGNSIRLRNVVSHEHGHGLGIAHVCPVNQTKLMEPFATTVFDGPQHDDILTGNRGYGDPNEHNDSAGSATNLGTLSNGTVTIGGVSVDDNGDVDYYRFSVDDTTRQVTVLLQPQGSTYLEGLQFGNGSCSAGSSFDSLSLNDVGVELIGTNGSTVLASVNSGGPGSSETLGPVPLTVSAGPYYVRIFGGSNDTAQLYQVSVTIQDAGAPPPAPPPPSPPTPNARTLSVSFAGTGGGTVTSNPVGLACSSSCSANFTEGSVITLNAVPATGSTFLGFTGDADCADGQVTMSTNVSCVATFKAGQTLTVTKVGVGAGTVTSTPAGINCGTACSANFADGTVVTLAAVAAAGSAFRGFGGDADCVDGSVTMTVDVSCTAVFAPSGGIVDRATRPLRLNADGRGDGIRYNAATGAWAMYVENGLPSLGAPVLAPTAGGVDAPGLTIKTGDFNGDGLSDLFLYLPASGRWFKAVNRGPDGFPLFGGSWTPPMWSLAIHDLSGDGRDDVFLYDPGTGAWVNGVSVGDGSEGFEYRQGLWAPHWRVHPVTLNGDPLGDFFLHDPVTGQWAGALNTGGDYTLYPGAWDPGWDVTPGDFTGNGVDDFFLYASGTGKWQLATIAGGGFSFSTGTAPSGRVVHPGDFDADGRTDLILYDPVSGIWELRLSDGTGSFAVVAGSFAPRRQIFPTRFNDDGRADLLLYDAGTGAYEQALNTGAGTFLIFPGTWAPNETIVATRP